VVNKAKILLFLREMEAAAISAAAPDNMIALVDLNKLLNKKDKESKKNGTVSPVSANCK